MERPDTYGERTEQPTTLRLAEARRRGQVARSSDLAGAILMLGTFALLALLAKPLLVALTGMTAALLGGGAGAAPAGAPAAADLAALKEPLLGSLMPVAELLAALLLGGVGVAVLANVVQVGLLAAPEAIRPDLSRLSASAGLRRLLSRRSLVRMAMGMAKVAAVAVTGYATVRPELTRIVSAGGRSSLGIAAEAGELALSLGLRIAIVLGVLAVLDYLYQRWQHRQDLMMTRRELKEDLRQMEGDPVFRRRLRRIARQRSGLAGPQTPKAHLGVSDE